MGAIDETLAKLQLTLPPAPKPVASYVPAVQTGNLVFVSGQLPSRDGRVLHTGPVRNDADIPQAAEAARLCTLNAIAVLKEACGGNLDHVTRIVRIGVFVQSEDAFHGQPKVANGASDLLVQVFGEAGKHARAAVGVNTLPLNATVEMELIAEVKG